jgi:phosphoglycolate phosphatase
LLIIFDLDGTLIDSSRDLTISTNAMRQHFGLPPLEQHVITSYVGNGAPVLVRRAIGSDASDETVGEALAYFLKYYRAHSMEHTRLYSGVREAVEELAAARQTLGVLTNKPQKISFDILGALGIQGLFAKVYGGDTFDAKKPNPEGILRMAEETSSPLSETLMVGDSKVDVQTALNAGVRSCGVLWGFQPETFREVKPDFQIERPRDLLEVIGMLSKAST